MNEYSKQPNQWRPLTIEKDIEGSRPHRVYDLSILDVDERRQKSIVFPSAEKTAQYLGVPRNHLAEVRGVGRQYFSKKHNKKFAIRIEPKEKIA